MQRITNTNTTNTMTKRAGLLSQVIKVETPDTIINEYGERVQTYHVSYTTRARVIHDRGSRDLANGEVFNSYSKTFLVRSYVPVSERDLIQYKGKKYRILTIEDRTEDYNDKQIVTELLNE